MTESIHSLVADILGVDPSEVTDDTSRETADNWDSLNHLRIVTAIEQELSIRLTMAEIEAATSVGRLISIVESKSNQA